MARYIDAEAFRSKLIWESHLNAKEREKLDFPSLVARVLDEMPTADVVPKSEVERAFSDLKKQIHDNTVYPKIQGVNPYISIRTFDAILNNVLQKHTEG